MKKTWAVTNETLNKNKKRKDEPLTFKCNGRDLSDNIEIANEFNRFFANFGEITLQYISRHLMHRIVNLSLLMKMQQLKP